MTNNNSKQIDDKREFVKRRISVAINTARKLIQDAKKLGGNLTEGEKLIVEAETAFESDELERAIRCAKKAEQIAKKLHEQTFIQEASIVFGSIKREIMKLRKISVDVKEVEDLFNAARRAYDEENYRDALEYSNRAENLIMELKQGSIAPEAPKLIVAIEKRMLELKRFGMDVKEVEKLLQKAKTAEAGGRFDRALEYANKADRALGVPKSELRDSIIGFFSAIETKLKTIEMQGGDVTDATTNLTNAKKALDAEQYEAAMDLAKNAEALIQTIETKVQQVVPLQIAKRELEPRPEVGGKTKLAINKIVSARASIRELRGLGADIAKYDGLLTLAQEALENNLPDKAIMYAEECINKIEQDREQLEVLKEFERSKRIISDAKDKEINIELAEGMLNQAKLAFRSDNLEKAVKLAKESYKVAEKLIQEHDAKLQMERAELEAQKKEVTESISKVESYISELTAMGLDCSKATELLTGARGALDREEIEDAKQLVAQSKVEADKIKEGTSGVEVPAHVTYDEVVAKLKFARARLDEAKNTGADVIRAEQLLRSARAPVEAEDYRTAMRLALECILAVDDALHNIKPESLLETCAEKINELKAMGANPITIEKLCNFARSAINDGAIDLAREYANQALVEANIVKSQYNDAQQLIGELQKKLENAKILGKDVSAADELFTQIITAMNSAEYDIAIKSAKKCIGELDKLDLGITAVDYAVSQADALDATRNMWSKIKDAQARGINVSTAEELLASARLHIKRGDYQLAMGYINKASENLESTLRVYNELVEAIQATQSKLTAVKAKGMDISDIESIYKKVTTAMDKGDYIEAKREALKLSEELDALPPAPVPAPREQPLIYERPKLEGEDRAQVYEMPQLQVDERKAEEPVYELREAVIELPEPTETDTEAVYEHELREKIYELPTSTENEEEVTTVACYNCGAMIDVDASAPRPLIVTCNRCGIQSQLE